MKLKDFDDKLVRIVDSLGEVYEGIGVHNSKEYNMHEYGVDEDSIVIFCVMFYQSDIKQIKEIDSFSSSFGRIEEVVLDGGIDLIDEAFYSENPIHVYRLLLCIEDRYNSLPFKNELNNLLKRLIRYNDDDKIKEKARDLLFQ